MRFMSGNQPKQAGLGEALQSARVSRKNEKLILAAAHALVAYQQAHNARAANETELRKELHQRLDAVDAEPECWTHVRDLVGRGVDEALADLMAYSLKRSQAQLKEMVREADQLPTYLPDQGTDHSPDPEPSKTRKRGR